MLETMYWANVVILSSGALLLIHAIVSGYRCYREPWDEMGCHESRRSVIAHASDVQVR